MKTHGDIEAALCVEIERFEKDYMGHRPTNIRSYLLGDLVVLRLQGMLTAAEQHLLKKLGSEKGRDLLKGTRVQLMETARPILEAMIGDITGVSVTTMHHDVSSVTGEKIMVFSLSRSPLSSEAKAKGPRSP